MKYENAYKGISKLFTAEILKLLVGIMSVVTAILGVFSLAGAMAGLEGMFVGFTIAAVILLVLILIFSIVSFILMMVGIVTAGKDEPFFKTALIWIIIGVTSTILTNIVTSVPVMQNIFTILATVADILSTFYIISGIIALADRIGNIDVSTKGQTIIKLIIATYVIAIIIKIVEMITRMNTVGVVISGILGIIALVASIVSYILFLVMLARGKKMLQNS